MLTVALFTIAKRWKYSKWPFKDEYSTSNKIVFSLKKEGNSVRHNTVDEP